MSASSRARRAPVDELRDRAIRIARRVRRNSVKTGVGHPLDRLIAAAAILLRVGNADPKDREVVAEALLLARRTVAADRPAAFSDEEKAAGRERWAEIKQAIRSSGLPATTLDMWVEPIVAVALTDSGLWLAAPEAVAVWVERRYASSIEDEHGVRLRLVAREG